MAYCPFVNGECRNDCVFRCRPRATTQSMVQETTTCVLASRIAELNDKQADQLDNLIRAVENLD